MRSEQQIQAVKAAAVAFEERTPPDLIRQSRDYAAGVADALAWLTGDVSPRVFRGFSAPVGVLTDAAEGATDAYMAASQAEPEWTPLEGVTGDFYELLIDVNLDAPISSGPLTAADMHHLAQLVGYAWASEVRGEPLGEPRIAETLPGYIHGFTVYADSTKSRSDDHVYAIERFLEVLPTVVAEGSPVRKSNRAGIGTKGTRLVEGFRAPVTLRVFAR